MLPENLHCCFAENLTQNLCKTYVLSDRSVSLYYNDTHCIQVRTHNILFSWNHKTKTNFLPQELPQAITQEFSFKRVQINGHRIGVKGMGQRTVTTFAVFLVFI